MRKHVNKTEWYIFCTALLALFLLKPLLGFAFILIMIFVYPQYKLYKLKLQRRRAQNQTSGNSTTIHWLSVFFPIILTGIPLGIFFFIRHVYRKVSSETTKIKGFETIPNWVWFVLFLVILGIIIWYFRKGLISRISRLGSSIPRPNISALSWKWLWIAGLVLIGGFALLKWVIPFIAEKQYRANENNVTTGTIVIKDPLFDSPRLNLNGENKMQKGQFFQFEINYDDPSISFDPKDSEVTVLYCQKKEDPTRKWRMYISKDKEGKKEVRFSPRVPLDKALVGTVYIKSENRDAVVVVSQKEN